jgi:hypothetical protein
VSFIFYFFIFYYPSILFVDEEPYFIFDFTGLIFYS